VSTVSPPERKVEIGRESALHATVNHPMIKIHTGHDGALRSSKSTTPRQPWN